MYLQEGKGDRRSVSHEHSSKTEITIVIEAKKQESTEIEENSSSNKNSMSTR